eukprot:scpid80535/ scgid33969/ 
MLVVAVAVPANVVTVPWLSSKYALGTVYIESSSCELNGMVTVLNPPLTHEVMGCITELAVAPEMETLSNLKQYFAGINEAEFRTSLTLKLVAITVSNVAVAVAAAIDVESSIVPVQVPQRMLKNKRSSEHFVAPAAMV